MARKVKYKVDPEFRAMTPALVEIKTKEGKLFSKRIDTIYGNPKDPLSSEDVRAKFNDCVRYAKKPLSQGKAEQLIEKILKLEEIEEMEGITDLLD